MTCFYSDEQGYLYFAGRKDDIIKSRGEKVSPREVESVLCGMTQVAEAAVIGVPDANIGGTRCKPFVVLRDGELLGTRQILRYCAEQMQDFMVPKFVSIVEALPKSPNGKIDRLALRSAQMRSMQ